MQDYRPDTVRHASPPLCHIHQIAPLCAHERPQFSILGDLGGIHSQRNLKSCSARSAFLNGQSEGTKRTHGLINYPPLQSVGCRCEPFHLFACWARQRQSFSECDMRSGAQVLLLDCILAQRNNVDLQCRAQSPQMTLLSAVAPLSWSHHNRSGVPTR